MPRFPIVTDTVEIVGGLNQGFILNGSWLTPDTPPRGGPGLMFRWDLTSINIPVAVGIAAAASGGTNPATAYLTMQLLLSGELAWQGSQAAQLTPFALAAGWVIANVIFADSLNQPIRYRNGQTFQFAYSLQLDQAVTAAGFIGLVLAGQYTNPSSATVEPAAASVGYSEVFDPLLVHV
jgi:hypothetical protein